MPIWRGNPRCAIQRLLSTAFLRIHILPDSLHQNQFTTYHKLLTLDVFLKWEAHWLLYCWETSRLSGQYIRSSKLCFFFCWGGLKDRYWWNLDDLESNWLTSHQTSASRCPTNEVGEAKEFTRQGHRENAKVLKHRFKSLVSHWWTKRPDFWNQNMGGIGHLHEFPPICWNQVFSLLLEQYNAIGDWGCKKLAFSSKQLLDMNTCHKNMPISWYEPSLGWQQLLFWLPLPVLPGSLLLLFFSCSGSCFCMFWLCPFDFPLLIVTFLTTSWHLSAVRGKDQKLWCWLGLKRFGAAWRRCALPFCHFANSLKRSSPLFFLLKWHKGNGSVFFSGVGANSSLFNSGLSRYPNTHLTSTSRCDVAPAQGTGQRAMMAQVGLLQTHQGFRGSQAALVSWRMVEMDLGCEDVGQKMDLADWIWLLFACLVVVWFCFRFLTFQMILQVDEEDDSCFWGQGTSLRAPGESPKKGSPFRVVRRLVLLQQKRWKP